MISPPATRSTVEILPFKLYPKSSHADAFHCEQILRNMPGKRLVYSGTWRQNRVVIKQFLDPKSSQRYWNREKNGVEALESISVDTPQLLFSGQLTDDTFVLVFEYLPQAETALQFWNALNSEDSRLEFLRQLLDLMCVLHEAGLTQEDLHLENFLVSGQKIYAIDGDAIGTQNQGKPLDLKSSSRNLSLFFAQLPPKFDSLMETTSLHYAQQRNIDGSQLLAQLQLDLPKTRLRRSHKYIKKCYRTCSEFVRSERTGQISISRRDAQGETLNRLLDDLDAFMRSGTILKAGRSSTVVRVQVDGCDWVIKRYNIKNPCHALSRCFRPTRAWISWGNSHLLKISGIATPRAIAMIEKRIGPLRSTGYYVCDYVAGVNAEDFFQDANVDAPGKKQVSENFVRLFELFCKLNIVHGDCKATNFLVKDDQPWVLDLDAMQECSSPARFKKLFQIDRQRFLRNWQSQPELQKWFDERLPGIGDE